MRCSGAITERRSCASGVGTYARHRRCGKKAHHFFEVRYPSGHRHVVGFCDACATGKRSSANWDRDTVYHNVGTPSSVVPTTEPPRRTKLDREREALMDRIMRIMSQKNCQKYRDEWPDIFDECARRFAVKSVMEG